MEKKLFSLLGGLMMLMTLFLSSSCVKITEPVRSDFKIERPSQTLYGSSTQIRFNSKKTSDSAALARRVSERCEKDMIRWADYSSLDAIIK